MATWRYSDTNSAEMAAIVGTQVGNLAGSLSSGHVNDKSDDENTWDLSSSNLDEFPDFLLENSRHVRDLKLSNNSIVSLPPEVGYLLNLVTLDVSHNHLKSVADEICLLHRLCTFVARNNRLTVNSVPKDFGTLPSLEVLNLSGNELTSIPIQFTELQRLKCLYLGGNSISTVPTQIQNMSKLEVLYLGGNCLSAVPAELGHVTSLVSLVLSDNRLESLPRTLVRLTSLRSLSLHNNRLETLPPDIIHLNLTELSLRNNPLVIRFVEELMYEAPSLLELAGRVVKLRNLQYSRDNLPASLVSYLDSAQSCVNPHCSGVYFTSRVEHVKFVDFCGKYRLPLMQYLCSRHCSETTDVNPMSLDDESEQSLPMSSRLKRVLLG